MQWCVHPYMTVQRSGGRKFQYLIMFLLHLTYMNKSDQWKLMRKISLHHGENSERVGDSLITMQ